MEFSHRWDAGCPVAVHREGKDVTLVTYGVILDQVMAAAEILSRRGIEATVLRLQEVSQTHGKLICERMSENRTLVCIEEVCTGSGIREALAWEMRELCPQCRLFGLDLGRRFVEHGSMEDLYRHYGLDPQSIASFVQGVL